jgi:hypothetical protein
MLNQRDIPEHKNLAAKLEKNWEHIGNQKSQNKDIFWPGKPKSELSEYRKYLLIAYTEQKRSAQAGEGDCFSENAVAEIIAQIGGMNRPGVSFGKTAEQYKNETTANKSHITSFRMSNRILKFLGFVCRERGKSNYYKLTSYGKQWVKFQGEFPSKMGILSESDFIVERLMNANVFGVHDTIQTWDYRFRNRIFLNLMRCININGYITNTEAVVTAFHLHDERCPEQMNQMIDRLNRLRNGEINIVDAYRECNIDPRIKPAVTGAYDGPKVLLSFCRSLGLLKEDNITEYNNGKLKDMYKKMFAIKFQISEPKVVNIITTYGKKILEQEKTRRLVGFDELYF